MMSVCKRVDLAIEFIQPTQSENDFCYIRFYLPIYFYFCFNFPSLCNRNEDLDVNPYN